MIVVVAASTSDCTLVFQFPIHRAVAPAATLLICVASAGRVRRHASAVCFALEYGFTQKVAPARALPVVGVEGAGVDVSGVLRDRDVQLSSMGDEMFVASPEQAARSTRAESATGARAPRETEVMLVGFRLNPAGLASGSLDKSRGFASSPCGEFAFIAGLLHRLNCAIASSYAMYDTQ